MAASHWNTCPARARRRSVHIVTRGGNARGGRVHQAQPPENHRVDLRTAAQMLAVRRVADALKLRGIFP
jgi:hypothetical protein